MQYDLSIIIPFYNGNNELSKLLSNLQTAIKYASEIKVEIIIVNDSPNCKVNCHGFESLNIKIITNHKNMGIHSSRVNGILNSNGKYIFMTVSYTHLDVYKRQGKYKGSFLGVLWSFLNPLLMVVVYAIVFPYIMRIKVDNYLQYLILSLIHI